MLRIPFSLGPDRRVCGRGLCLLLALTTALLAGSHAGTQNQPQSPAAAEHRIRAPELEGGIAWLNTPVPLHLKDLRGKIVLLDFWTYCCINCIHTLPDLARLEQKYPNQLVVIGIHSAKFDNEKNSDSIRQAIRRYEIHHPVVNDAHLRIWNAYAVQAWPTLCLIDPEGNLVGRASGEGHYEALDRVISQLIRTGRGSKTLDEKPLPFQRANRPDLAASPLLFPGKVLANDARDELFIADSTHHRIVITNRMGKEIAIAGAGEPGSADGPFEQARFNDPQGMALASRTLYVADRKNNLLRALDLDRHTVTTVAGTGVQGSDRQHGGPALQIALNSPWALLLHDQTLYLAQAGYHQIWRLDLPSQQLTPFAGNGVEDIIDGPLAEASFAQPSGLASDGSTLYVADSESSSIRSVPLSGAGQVQTLVGKGLFDFGDVDGPARVARLQHPLGLAWKNGLLYVADTYNNKVKVIDPAQRTCATLVGPTASSGDRLLHEPAGLSIAGSTMYIADTNAHRILKMDLTTKAVAALDLEGITPPAMRSAAAGKQP